MVSSLVALGCFFSKYSAATRSTSRVSSTIRARRSLEMYFRTTKSRFSSRSTAAVNGAAPSASARNVIVNDLAQDARNGCPPKLPRSLLLLHLSISPARTRMMNTLSSGGTESDCQKLQTMVRSQERWKLSSPQCPSPPASALAEAVTLDSCFGLEIH